MSGFLELKKVKRTGLWPAVFGELPQNVYGQSENSKYYSGG